VAFLTPTDRGPTLKTDTFGNSRISSENPGFMIRKKPGFVNKKNPVFCCPKTGFSGKNRYFQKPG
jgi:hypothetical protein